MAAANQNATSASANPTNTTSTNIQVLVKAEVLGVEVDGGYQQSGGNSAMVVYGKADANASPKSISDFANEFGVDKAYIENNLPKEAKSVMDNVTVTLKQVYMLSKKSADGEEKHYAVWIQLNINGIPQGFPIQVKSISLKIWTNSVPQAIKDDLKISEMQKLLDGASSSSLVSAN